MEQGQGLCSPPKIRRVVQLSPSGMICTPTGMSVCSNELTLTGSSSVPRPQIPQLPVPPSVLTRCCGHVRAETLSTVAANYLVSSACIVSQRELPQRQPPVLSCTRENQQPPLQSASDDTLTSNMQLEGTMLEQALDTVMSLPEVVDEVRQNHQGQSNEIHRQQRNIKTLQEKLKAVQERNEDIAQEISSVKNKIHFTEELSRTKSRSCKECEKEIRELIKENENLEQELRNKTEKLNDQKRIWEEYRTKMKSHQDAVAQHESSAEVFRQLKERTEKLENLRVQYREMKRDPEQMEKIVTGVVERELREDISSIKEEQSARDQRLKQKINQIQAMKSSQKQVEQTIKVLHKKNAAQLTRLKRRLKETQLHSRHWNDQALQLQKNIAQAKQKLEE